MLITQVAEERITEASNKESHSKFIEAFVKYMFNNRKVTKVLIYSL
jgi:hypothetical protein